MAELDYKVLKLLQRKDEPLKISEIAEQLNLPHSTVGSSVKRLEEEGCVFYRRYNPVKLTPKGRDLAIEIIRHAQLMEVLLYRELDLTAAEAHEESEKLNLLFSCNTINKICQKYGHPDRCPCGEKILNASSCACEKDSK